MFYNCSLFVEGPAFMPKLKYGNKMFSGCR